MAQIEFRKLSKRFDPKRRTIKEVDLHVKDGEFVVLVGPSGCGKSTILRLIAGLETTDEGDILIDGERVNDQPPAERNVAMVFQDYALYPHMTVKENLSFALKMKKEKKDEIEQRIAWVADLLNLTELLERKPSQLSGGQRQRVAIGRAMVRKPKVFLFDEPLSNLDAKLRSQTRIELSALQRRLNATTIYVTHDQVEALTLADKLVVLNNGRIEQVGSPMNIFEEPASRFVGSFIGSPGMNFFDGELNGKVFKAPGLHLDFDSLWTPPSKGQYCIGIRPKDLYLKGLAPESINRLGTFPATIRFIEKLGHEAHVIFAVNGHDEVILRTTHFEVLKHIRSGQQIEIQANMEAFHWFEPGENGRRIGKSNQPATQRMTVVKPN